MKQETWTLDKGNKHSFSRALVENETNGKSDHSIATVGAIVCRKPILFASANGKRPTRTPAAADNTPPVFDQKYGGVGGIEYKKEAKCPLAALTLLGAELFTFVFVQKVLAVQFLQRFIQVYCY